MQEISENPTVQPEEIDGLKADALRAEAWAGEPFLHEGEDPAAVLARGSATARRARQALRRDRARADARPSPQWKVRFGLMLGLERVLSEKPPQLASGTELRRHQIDALAGMLTELIAVNQAAGRAHGERQRRLPPRSSSPRTTTKSPIDEAAELERRRGRGGRGGRAASRARTRAPCAASGSATRRRRARRSPPPASSRRRAAEGVLILTHRRLLVDQFTRELTDRATAEPPRPRRSRTARAPRRRRRSRSRPTPGSRATSARSPARPTSS